MADLLLVNDPDLVDFTSEDDGPPTNRALFYLRAACEEVRRYCGWHIAPSQTETVSKLPIGSQGILMLPSLYVTDVASVFVDNVVLDPAGYEWFRQGFIETRSPVYRYGWTGLVGGGGPLATVTMTHGYTSCPLDVKAVLFDLMETAIETPRGGVESVTAPGYGVTFSTEDGNSLSQGMRDKLAPYRIGGVR